MSKEIAILLALGVMLFLYLMALFVGNRLEAYEERKYPSRFVVDLLEYLSGILLFLSFPIFFIHLLIKLIAKGLDL